MFNEISVALLSGNDEVSYPGYRRVTVPSGLVEYAPKKFHNQEYVEFPPYYETYVTKVTGFVIFSGGVEICRGPLTSDLRLLGTSSVPVTPGFGVGSLRITIDGDENSEDGLRLLIFFSDYGDHTGLMYGPFPSLSIARGRVQELRKQSSGSQASALIVDGATGLTLRSYEWNYGEGM